MAARYKKEFDLLSKNPDFEVIGNDIKNFKVKFMVKNKNSPYYFPNKKYTLMIKYEYGNGEFNFPVTVPYIKFIDSVYHPNVDDMTGELNLIISEEWSPLMTVEGLIVEVIYLLNHPISPASDFDRSFLKDRSQPVVLNTSALSLLGKPGFKEAVKSNTTFYDDFKSIDG
jgi:ubiquitin-protein ligase